MSQPERDHTPDPSVIDTMTAHQIASLPLRVQDSLIARALDEMKQRLAGLADSVDHQQADGLRLWAASIADIASRAKYPTRPRQDALEMQRRTERTLGLVVTNAQAAGVLAGRDNPRTKPGPARNYLREGKLIVVPGVVEERHTLPSATDIWGHGSHLRIDAGHLAAATEDDFDAAITYLRDANVTLTRARLVAELTSPPSKLVGPQRAARIAELAGQGWGSPRIAEDLGHTPDFVRRLARENGIDIPHDRLTRGTVHGMDHARILRETAIGLEATVSGLTYLDISAVVDDDDFEGWVDSIERSLRSIRKTHRRLHESRLRKQLHVKEKENGS